MELMGAVLHFDAETRAEMRNSDDDDDEIAYFTVRWKTREIVLSIPHQKHENTDKDSKNRKRYH